MRVKYIHFSEPDKVKIHDTKLVLKNNRFITKTELEFDDFTLRKMKRDLENGILLFYEPISVDIDGNECSAKELREGYRVITGLDNDKEFTDTEIFEYMLNALLERESEE